MTDVRANRVLDEVRRRYPHARVTFEPCPDRDSIPIPILLIVFDGDRDALLKAEDHATALTRATFLGEPVPFTCHAIAPDAVEAYLDPASWVIPSELASIREDR